MYIKNRTNLWVAHVKVYLLYFERIEQIKYLNIFLTIEKYKIITRLRMFMQIHIFMNTTKEIGKSKQRFASFTKSYESYNLITILLIFYIFF